ncbi:hypothetical protein N665_0245s0068 [Sinapis alba]|nr:hypothetical protein N665_0245s0068 [Sinapis alba]
MSSSSSSVAQPQKCNDINVAVEESKEKATENNNSGLGSNPQEVVSERRRENPSLGYGSVLTRNGNMRHYTSESNKLYACRFCNKLFSSAQGLGGHMNSHKHDLEWEKKRKVMEQESQIQWMLHQYSQKASSNDNHDHGITFEPSKRRCTDFHPSLDSGLMDMNMTVVPPMAPPRFFTGNTFTNGSPSGGLGLVPPYNSYPPTFPGNLPPLPPLGTTNLPSYWYPQENVTLKLGNDNVVETGDDDGAADQPEVTSKSWGADLSLSL